MSELTPAEELRQAAEIMRVRAEGYGRGEWHAEVHTASWRPCAALAVADLLDDCAAELSPGSAAILPRDKMALAVARAYLGTGDPGMRSQNQEGSSDDG